MSNYLTVRKIEQPYTKHVIEAGVVDDKYDIQEVMPIFSKACMIVDAQFYYTNPLLFVFISEKESENFAQLYDNYYLIPPRFYDTISIEMDCLAINAMFIKHICSLVELAEEEPTLKPTTKELQERETSPPNALHSLFALYQEQGLYVIGIKK